MKFLNKSNGKRNVSLKNVTKTILHMIKKQTNS